MEVRDETDRNKRFCRRARQRASRGAMSGVYTIDNGVLKVSARATGGELDALIYAGRDYLWQGDAAYWRAKAPNLFPYIARLVDKTYTHKGAPYHLDIHGFVRTAELDCRHTADEMVFTLASNAETRARYPFDFIYRIRYRLDGNKLVTVYEVDNLSAETMYFGIGGHPGFGVPMEEGLDFSDYALVFDRPCHPRRVTFSADNFVTGDVPYPLPDDTTLPLRHDLFDEDAIILRDAARQVTLRSEKGVRKVTVSYPDFDYVGFWHMPRTDAPYVCIEPWSSLPARAGHIEELTEQPGLVRLEKGGRYRNAWTIALE